MSLAGHPSCTFLPGAGPQAVASLGTGKKTGRRKPQPSSFPAISSALPTLGQEVGLKQLDRLLEQVDVVVGLEDRLVSAVDLKRPAKISRDPWEPYEQAMASTARFRVTSIVRPRVEDDPALVTVHAQPTTGSSAV